MELIGRGECFSLAPYNETFQFTFKTSLSIISGDEDEITMVKRDFIIFQFT